MKRIIINGIFALVFGLLAPQIATAQGTTTFLSNLGQSSAGSNSVGSDSWLAAEFITGNNANGYFLISIQLAMLNPSGSPSGFTVMVYDQYTGPVANLPGSSLGTLTGSANPSTTGIYTYTAPSDLTLSAGTPYYIVLTSGTTIANGAYEWSYTSANSYSPIGQWSGGPGGVLLSSNGSEWSGEIPAYSQFALLATPVPEPGVIGLLALGGLLLAFCAGKHGPFHELTGKGRR